MEIIAKIEGIVFSNASTGFCILRAKPTVVNGSGQDKNVVIKGTFPGANLSIGLKVKFNGMGFEEHPTYGQQFHAQTCEIIPEKGRNGVITYLASNIPSIGPITAAKLYSAFGDELINMLNNKPEEVAKLEFLTSVQSKTILEEWKKSNETRTAALFLADLGLNSYQIKSVYTMFGSESIPKVKDNPYSLYECPGVGFQTADNVARKLGIGADDPRRVRSLILFIISELARSEGHMYCTSDQILESASKVFSRNNLEPFAHGEYISHSDLYSSIDWLKNIGRIYTHNDRIYLYNNWIYESASAECVTEIIKNGPKELGNLEDIIQRFETDKKLVLSDEQRNAFLLLKQSRICVVSGYPGTGKTLLISAFVNLFEENNLDYVLLSPTGIASKRLSQMTGRPASTIHRALGYGFEGKWEFDRSNKYHVDAVIVDEMSMVDGDTFYHLITALTKDTILVLVGDPAQLPSVGAGHVLHSLMDNSIIPHVSLTQIYRQEGESDIITIAHSILLGKEIDTSFKKESEVVFLNFEKEKTADEICKITSIMRGKKSNFQVIAPMYDGDLGVNNLNRKLREVLNTQYSSNRAAKIKHGSCDLYEGDRVMVIRNDYDRMIYNGDVGKVHRISIRDDEVEVRIFNWFDYESGTPRYIDKLFTFNIEEARSVLKVAYACTAHRTQGQEFDFVLLPMTMQYGYMLYKNLIYTALTRAKKKVFIFGDSRAFLFAVNNIRETVRNSSLADLINEYSDLRD